MEKTTLAAVQLLRELLATRHGQEDEPVLLSIAGWDTRVFPPSAGLAGIAAGPGLPGAARYGPGLRGASDTGGAWQILPVLDGMDELPVAQAAVITALNRVLGWHRPTRRD